MDETHELLRAILHRLEIQGAQLDQILIKMDYMQGDINSIKENITLMKKDIISMKKDIAATQKEVFSIKTGIKFFNEGQERQDRILESLSARSLEQETMIRELRRAN